MIKYTGMTVDKAMKIVYKGIGNTAKENKTQDPDAIKLHKQWSERGVFKGYWVDVIYNGKRGFQDLVVSFDITPYYTRTIGSPEAIPLFTPGVHNFPDTKKAKKIK